MRFGEICRGGRVLDRYREIEATDDEGTYHRRTHVVANSSLLMKVKSSQPSWIAVKVHEYICVIPRHVAPEDCDIVKMFNAFVPQKAIVSLNLNTNEFQDGSGSAASLAEYNEIATIVFLREKLRKPNLKYKDAIEITRDAFRMFSGDIKANEFETYAVEKNKLPSKEIDFQDVFYESERKKITRGKIKCTRDEISGTYSRETQIWCGGWDSQLHNMQFCGFSWIAVHGKDSVCVVTQDKVGKGFLEDLSHHLEGGNPLFGRMGYVDLSSKKSSMMSPFAVVSVVLGCDEVDAESCDNKVSIAEIEAVELLAKQMDNVPNFTPEVTVKTAIAAFICLAGKDLSMEKKANIFILRKGKLPVVTVEMTYKETVELLLMEASQHLMDTIYEKNNLMDTEVKESA